jgi:hypothetical protein
LPAAQPALDRQAKQAVDQLELQRSPCDRFLRFIHNRRFGFTIAQRDVRIDFQPDRGRTPAANSTRAICA